MGLVKWLAKLSCGHVLAGTSTARHLPAYQETVPCTRCAYLFMPKDHPDHIMRKVLDLVTDLPQRGPDGRL